MVLCIVPVCYRTRIPYVGKVFRMLKQQDMAASPENTDLQAIDNKGVTTIDEIMRSVRPNVVRFCELYAANGNQVKSALLAGFVSGYGAQLWTDPRVRALVAYYREVYAEQAGLTRDALVKLWARQASFSPAVLLQDDWSLKRLDELTSDQREHLHDALLGIEVVEKQGQRTVKPRFNRQLAQEHLGKLFGMYGDDKESEKRDGLTLNINVGQQITVGEGEVEEIGHLRVRLPADDQGESG